MRQEDEPIDVTTLPELRRLAEEVQSSGKTRLLRRNGEALAMIVPLATKAAHHHAGRALTPQDVAAFRTAAGTWSDIDLSEFLLGIYVARDVPDERPRVEL